MNSPANTNTLAPAAAAAPAATDGDPFLFAGLVVMVEVAIAYLRASYSVVPCYALTSTGECSCHRGRACRSPGRHPIPGGWQRYCSELPTEAQVRAWWAQHPHANIGLCTGTASRLVVLDVDRHTPEVNGEAALAALAAEGHDIPSTVTQRTPRTGRHLAYRTPEGVVIGNSDALPDGIDVRAQGGLIIVAPSSHFTGGTYHWEGYDGVPPLEDVVDAPDWLLEKLTSAPPDGSDAVPFEPDGVPPGLAAIAYGEAALTGQAMALAAMSPGSGRNHKLYVAARRAGELRMACGIDDERALQILSEAARKCGLAEDDGEAEIRRVFSNGWGKGIASPKAPPGRDLVGRFSNPSGPDNGSGDPMHTHTVDLTVVQPVDPRKPNHQQPASSRGEPRPVVDGGVLEQGQAATDGFVEAAPRAVARPLVPRTPPPPPISTPSPGLEFSVPEAAGAYLAQHNLGLTDVGNGQRLVSLFGQFFVYVNDWNKFLTWLPPWRWYTKGGYLRMKAMAAAASQAILLEADAVEVPGTEEAKDRASSLRCWANKSASDARLKAMISWAQHLRAVSHTWLDRDPYLLQVGNGVIDLRTGAWRPSVPEDYLTKASDVFFDPNARCPLWLAFLDRIFRGDQELIAWVQRWVGWCLTGDVGEHMLVFAYGSGRNGKGVFTSTLEALLGEYAIAMPPKLLMARRGNEHPTEFARLHGARLVSAPEVPQSARWDEETVKRLTGGDTISARRMREDFWDFGPTHKLIVSGNHKPVVWGTDEAIWSRLVMVPFTVFIPPEERDLQLAEKLRGELSGILNWAIRGCQAWQIQGLGDAKAIRAASAEYRTGQDVVGIFLTECCATDPTLKVPVGELHNAFSRWAKHGGYPVLSQAAFKGSLESRGFALPRKSTGGRYFWFGLEVRADRVPVD